MSQPLNHDLNALKNLFLLYRERSVTKAAFAAGVTQPSMSRTLNKLRETYNDRLFVRQKDVLVPTPKADYLMSELSPLFEQVARVIDTVEPLQPDSATGKFRFSAPDFVSKFSMANLPSGILTMTPKIEFSYHYWNVDIEQKLKSGDIDLAFGYLPECPNHVKKHALSTDHYVILHREGHPHEGEWDEQALVSFPHIALQDSGWTDDFVDRSLSARGMMRQKMVSTPDIVAGFSLLLKSDYVMVAPAKLANYLCPEAIQVPYPIDAPDVEYALYWGAIKDHDPLHQYIREVIKVAFETQWPTPLS